MRLSRFAALGLAIGALVTAQGSAQPGTSSREAHTPVARAVQPGLSTTLTAYAVPAQLSFDDLSPGREAARARLALVPTRTVAPRPTKARPRPPAVKSQDLPPAGTPQAVLAAAYLSAVAKAPAGCHLRPEHLAAIGQVESGSVGGRTVTGDHRVSPAIWGPLLDGGPFAVVHDSDGGALDGAGDFDRAMGPLQFLPGTWRWAGADGDGDGRRDPQNVYDAALATAGYLCEGGRDLSSATALRSAVLAYNQSGDYLSTVLDWVGYFHTHGLSALTEVAFRVGSGGRASDLAEPVKPPKPPADDAADAPAGAARPSPTTTSTPTTTTAPATPGATPSPATTTTTPPPPGSTTTPTPTPTPATTESPTPTSTPTSPGSTTPSSP